MASPSPFFTSNQDSLFVSPSPDPPTRPLQRQLSNQWERPSAPPRNPSFTLPPPIPSISRRNTQRQHPQPDPTLYQNQWFSGQASGSNGVANGSNSRQQGAQPQQLSREGNYYFYTPAEAQQPYQDQASEPGLPSPSIAQATIGNLTPSRFDLQNGENYLTSTPDGGWNFNDIDFSDGLDLVPDSNYNDNNNNNNNNNNNGGADHDLDHFDLFHPNWTGGIDPFALPPPPPQVSRQQEAVHPPYEAQAQRAQPWSFQGLSRYEGENRQQERNQAVDLTHTSPAMPCETANSRKRAAPSAATANNTAAARASRNRQSPSGSNNSEISPPPAKRKKVVQQERDRELDDLFGSQALDKEDEVDLVGVDDDEDYEKQKARRKEEEVLRKRKEEQEKPVKLAQQQCVICLDQPEGLTVTHCGHMFCAECLHGALNTNMMGKRVCPVCRANINTNRTKQNTIPKTGIYHMEMKLQSRKQGKMPKKQ